LTKEHIPSPSVATALRGLCQPPALARTGGSNSPRTHVALRASWLAQRCNPDGADSAAKATLPPVRQPSGVLRQHHLPRNALPSPLARALARCQSHLGRPELLAFIYGRHFTPRTAAGVKTRLTDYDEMNPVIRSDSRVRPSSIGPRPCAAAHRRNQHYPQAPASQGIDNLPRCGTSSSGAQALSGSAARRHGNLRRPRPVAAIARTNGDRTGRRIPGSS